MPINEDRGEALIRQRIRERKRDKRTKQRDNSDADASRSLISDSTEKPQSQSVSNPPMSASFRDNGKGVHGHAHFDDTKRMSMDEQAVSDNDPTPQALSDLYGVEAQDSTLGDFDENQDDQNGDELDYTVKDRQDAINIEHPFGLPIWKPALYKKSRSIQRRLIRH